MGVGVQEKHLKKEIPLEFTDIPALGWWSCPYACFFPAKGQGIFIQLSLSTISESLYPKSLMNFTTLTSFTVTSFKTLWGP